MDTNTQAHAHTPPTWKKTKYYRIKPSFGFYLVPFPNINI